MTTATAERAKWAFTTRRVARDDAVRLDPDVARAVSGDLVLGRVEALGAQQRLQLASGRPSALYPGDLVVVVCGDRYAPDQFEGIAEIDPEGADLLAAGGVVGAMRHCHLRMAEPTRIVPLGLLQRGDGMIVNVDHYRLPAAVNGAVPATIGVIGASMNAGKTTAAASLIHGLSRAGRHVAAIKATGTGAYGDLHSYTDAGAALALDFTDVGMVSTYRQPLARVEEGLRTLLAQARPMGCDVAVVELADGLFQEETAALLKAPSVRGLFDGFVFAAGDALAVVGGIQALRAMTIEPLVVTGLISRSPLACREAETTAGIDIWTRDGLRDPAHATALLARARACPVSPAIARVNVAA